MRVLHLSTSDIRGGAAKGTFSLHRALRDMGIESRMLVGRKHSDDPHVSEVCGYASAFRERIRGVLDAMPLRPYRKTDDSYWTVGWLPRKIVNTVDSHKPDLVHLHWTGGGFLSVQDLREIQVPVVWTLRDMWAMTGGCHYTAGCNRYTFHCGRCPQLCSGSPEDLSRRNWERKYAAWKDMHMSLIAISRWLAECAEASGLFPNSEISVIPNGVDVRTFRPHPRLRTLRELGMPADKRHILFGALGALSDRRKGYLKLIEAINRLRDFGDPDAVTLNVFGDVTTEDLPSLGVETRMFGEIDDDELLSKIYSACDVMVAPSLQEAFGKTLVEAMASGTPVVAFNNGGPADIVRHRHTGYLATPFDPVDLARGIAWCIEDQDRMRRLRRAARERAESEYDMVRVGTRYVDLYRHVLETRQ
ncbi:MAG: glycosyl transferase [Rhodospirillales bacterium CG15_BIG_FIL_POST_REV_8_21_14_020_66_15]|nr:MAG: glycosyl transferase [Rhodospirillales bacterium CG15_BIG_FIL_POST_REV_8_21_14_020_66_15]